MGGCGSLRFEFAFADLPLSVRIFPCVHGPVLLFLSEMYMVFLPIFVDFFIFFLLIFRGCSVSVVFIRYSVARVFFWIVVCLFLSIHLSF